MTAPASARATASRSSTASRSKAETKKKATKTRVRSAGSSTRTRSTGERGGTRREDRRVQRDTSDRSRKQRPIAERQPSLTRPKSKQLQSKVVSSRLPLVVSGMVVLGVGLVATLWLSIAAVSGSYELQRGEQEITALTEQKERLVWINSAMGSTPALQQRAEAEGLVPGPRPAYLVKNPDGSLRMVGEPTPAPQPEPGQQRAAEAR